MADWVEPGDRAPDFTLPADDGGKIKLSSLRGQPVVLYFYPRDDTPGCTKEACAFRDRSSALAKLGVQVLGVSADSVDSHVKFRDKFKLNFPLLADPGHKVAEAYGAWREKTLYGKTSMGIQRSTFLIDREGTVKKAWKKVSVEGHGFLRFYANSLFVTVVVTGVSLLAASLVAFVLTKRPFLGSRWLFRLLLVSMMVALLAVSGPVLPAVYVGSTAGDLALLAGLGLLMGLGHLGLIQALRLAPSAVVAPFHYSQIVWAVIFGLLLFGDRPEQWMIVGSAVIIASGLYILWRETVRGRLVH